MGLRQVAVPAELTTLHTDGETARLAKLFKEAN